jgi:hypothetical protein
MKTDNLEALVRLVDNGVLTRNEARKELGLEPYPSRFGDVPFVGHSPLHLVC